MLIKIVRRVNGIFDIADGIAASLPHRSNSRKEKGALRNYDLTPQGHKKAVC
jgi:hypothetical protein